MVRKIIHQFTIDIPATGDVAYSRPYSALNFFRVDELQFPQTVPTPKQITASIQILRFGVILPEKIGLYGGWCKLVATIPPPINTIIQEMPVYLPSAGELYRCEHYISIDYFASGKAQIVPVLNFVFTPLPEWRGTQINACAVIEVEGAFPDGN